MKNTDKKTPAEINLEINLAMLEDLAQGFDPALVQDWINDTVFTLIGDGLEKDDAEMTRRLNLGRALLEQCADIEADESMRQVASLFLQRL